MICRARPVLPNVNGIDLSPKHLSTQGRQLWSAGSESVTSVRGLLVRGLLVKGLLVRGLLVRGLLVRGLLVRGLLVRGLLVRGLLVRVCW